MKKFFTSRVFIVTLLVVVAVMSRLLPHVANFSPIAAIAIFCGALYGHKWYAYVVPMAAMLITDIILGMHPAMLAVYASLALTVFIGTKVACRMSFINTVASSIVAAVLFFVITNFACWGLYTYTWAGLVECYTMALPFFRMTLLSNVVFSAIFYGVYYIVNSRVLASKRA